MPEKKYSHVCNKCKIKFECNRQDDEPIEKCKCDERQIFPPAEIYIYFCKKCVEAKRPQ